MIRFIDRYFSSTDSRGSITGIVNIGEWREINLVRSDGGIVRGNHYHETTEEGFFILQGKIDIVLHKVYNGKVIGEKIFEQVAAGQVFIIEPMTLHDFHVCENSVWINFLSKAMDKSNPDIHRLL